MRRPVPAGLAGDPGPEPALAMIGRQRVETARWHRTRLGCDAMSHNQTGGNLDGAAYSGLVPCGLGVYCQGHTAWRRGGMLGPGMTARAASVPSGRAGGGPPPPRPRSFGMVRLPRLRPKLLVTPRPASLDPPCEPCARPPRVASCLHIEASGYLGRSGGGGRRPGRCSRRNCAPRPSPYVAARAAAAPSGRAGCVLLPAPPPAVHVSLSGLWAVFANAARSALMRRIVPRTAALPDGALAWGSSPHRTGYVSAGSPAARPPLARRSRPLLAAAAARSGCTATGEAGSLPRPSCTGGRSL